MDPKFLSLNNVLANHLFNIPDYQRPYSWETKQRDELFNDIKEVTPNSDRKHFMSTIVCLKRGTQSIRCDEFEQLDVVDGQQRLTTLIILFKAIEKKLEEKSKENNEKEIREIKDTLVKADRRIILLQTNHSNRDILRDYLVEGVLPQRITTLTADINMTNAIKECEKFIADKDAMKIYTTIKNRLEFVFYILENEAIVYTIFEVLNSRGMDVDLLDKLKCVLMGLAFDKFGKSASTERITEIKEKWTDIYRHIGNKNISGQEIVRFAATLASDNMPSKALGGEEALTFFKDKCKQDAGLIIKYSSLIRDVADTLKNFYSNKRLESVTDIIHARLLASAIELSKLREEDKDNLLSLWEKISFKIFGIDKKDARSEVGNYVKLAWKIYTGEINFREAKKELSEIEDKCDIETAIKNNIRDCNCYDDWEKELRYLLFRYEEHLAKESKVEIPPDIWESIWNNSPATTIEHIFPQNETTPEAWKGKVGKDENWKEKNIHNIGNLMLLPPKINNQAKDKGFAEKKEIYKRYRIGMVQEVLNENDWNYQSIEKRQEKIIEWIRETWG